MATRRTSSGAKNGSKARKAKPPAPKPRGKTTAPAVKKRQVAPKTSHKVAAKKSAAQAKTSSPPPEPQVAEATNPNIFGDFFKQFGGQLNDNRFATAWQKYLQSIGEQPELLAELSRKHAERQSQLLNEISTTNGNAETAEPTGRPDPRFSHEAWSSNPFFRYLKDSYLLNSELIRETAAAANIDASDRRALDFMLEQMIAAMSPANFPATNPEVIATTLESKGENLRRGAANYLQDAQLGAITQTDPDAFAIGKNVAVTPGKVIFQNHLFQLIEYQPSTPKVNATPVLIVPPCINKYYILDLAEHNSFVRHLVDSGQRVFLVSWVNAGELQADLTWDDYVAGGVLEALAIVIEVGGQQAVHTLGYCIGGTLLACALAVAGKNKTHVKSMSLLTCMLDHCDTGNVGLFVDDSYVSLNEDKFAAGGIFDGLHLRRTFAYMRPDELVWPYVVRNYLLGETPPPFDILHWNADATNLPGKMYSWYLRHNYLDNDLITGTVEVCGSQVDYGAINLPGMIVATERDHIVPWAAAYASARRLSKNVEFVLASSGHVAGVVNPPARNKGHHYTGTKLGSDPQAWLSAAKKTAGSWWPKYFAFLDKHSGGQVAAPMHQGSSRFRPFEDAPGSYVTAPLPKVGG